MEKNTKFTLRVKQGYVKKVFLFILLALCCCACSNKKKSGQEVKTLLGVLPQYAEQELVDELNSISREENLDIAQNRMVKLFDRIVEDHASDTTRHAYQILTEIVEKYLYDPNSMMRDEDLYLPFVQKMANCEYTSEDRRLGYVYQAKSCALNQRGQKVTDFRICDKKGRITNLYSVKGQRILLFFSNPGCHACEEIITALNTTPQIIQAIECGYLKIVNVYIDEDLQAWADYVKAYPDTWLSGYDIDLKVRDGGDYDVRAIPSIYLLDSEMRVILKDAPTEKAIFYIINR